MIAIIAGTGTLPLEACKNLTQRQQKFFVVSLFPEDNAHDLKTAAGDNAEIIAEQCYKPAKILNLLKEKETKKVLFIGKVDKQNLLKHLKFDWLALKLMGSLFSRGDKDIMEALLTELNKNGIETLSQEEVLGGLRVPPGILCGQLTPEIERDIQVGINIAMKTSEFDIGQTVIIKDGMILAVEAIEGTDACIKRGIQLGTKDIVVCKAASPCQNKKFDLPTLGPSSLASFKDGQIKAIAWLSSHTLIAQKHVFIKKAQELRITLVSI